MDVRPAARVAGREDALERHDAVRVGRLDAAQVVLVRPPPGSTASSCRRGRSARRRRRRRRSARSRAASWIVSLIVSGTPWAVVVDEPKLDRMSCADDAALVEHVGAVRAVAGERAGGLLGDDARSSAAAPRWRSRRHWRVADGDALAPGVQPAIDEQPGRDPAEPQQLGACGAGRACRGRRRGRGRSRRARRRPVPGRGTGDPAGRSWRGPHQSGWLLRPTVCRGP